MLRRIEFLRGFGPFQDFTWDAGLLSDFSQYNLIYGWNYSGKTTLSRAFQAIERGALEPSLSGGSFRIALADGTTLDERSLTPTATVRVFNRNYVTRNFLEAESSAHPVFILGERAIQLQRSIAHLDQRARAMLDIEAAADREIRGLEARRDGLGTALAGDVAKLTLEKTFNRTRLEEVVAEYRSTTLPPRLSDDELAAESEYIRRAGDLVAQPIRLEGAKKLLAAAHGLRSTLEERVTFTALTEFDGKVALEAWVASGVSLHEERSDCAFCGSVLSEARREDLARHFSAAFRRVATELTAAEDVLARTDATVTIPQASQFAPECRDLHAKLDAAVASWNAIAEALRRELREHIAVKRADPATSIEVELAPALELLENVETLTSEITASHQAVVSDQATRAVDARAAIKRSKAAQYLGTLAAERVNEKLGAARTRKAKSSRIKARCIQRGREFSIDAAGVQRGAEMTTQILGALLGDTTLTAEVDSATNRFRFYRTGVPAVNLSDGERTAVTFAHFLAELHSGVQPLDQMVVFIDDPISSLDSGNVYSIFATIQSRLHSVRQLFVSTHNADFFGYLKSHWRNRGAWRNDVRAYFTRRLVDAQGVPFSNLEALPEPLARFGSEYEFIVSELSKFSKEPTPDLQYVYSSANLLRRFLESYLGFRKPHPGDWGKKLDLLLPDPIRASAIKKFCDDGSHLQSRNRALEHAVFAAHAQGLVREVLAALKERDALHYDSLNEALKLEG